MFNSYSPISTIREDQLDRKFFAQQIAKSILLYGRHECLTIGIYGDWGEGKSSLAYNALVKFEKNECLTTDVLKKYIALKCSIGDIVRITSMEDVE